jgi:hypothetical protein
VKRRPAISVENNVLDLFSQDDLDKYIHAQQMQIENHFREVWNASATLFQHDPTSASIPGAWVLAFLRDSDQAGALGYHDVTSSGSPIIKIFVGDDLKYGYSPTVTASHEVLETLGDPLTNRVAQGPKGLFYAYENCDACEADEFGYTVAGVQLSDFVTEEYFLPGSDGPYDYKNHIRQPFEILPGGYMAVFDPQHGWTQITNGDKRGAHISERFRLRLGRHIDRIGGASQ